VLGSHVS